MRFSRSTHLVMSLSLETLSAIIRTGLPIMVELIDFVNSVIFFFISNDLTHTVNFPTRIPDCDSYRPALLNLLFSLDASICSAKAFPPLGNPGNVVSVSINFPSNSQRDARFNLIAFDYSRADWDGLSDHFRCFMGGCL